VSATQAAIIVVLIVLIVAFYLGAFRGRFAKGRFVSKRAEEVHSRAQELFQKGGGSASYSDYRGAVPGADPVQYSDVHRLYREGRMTPEAVQGVL